MMKWRATAALVAGVAALLSVVVGLSRWDAKRDERAAERLRESELSNETLKEGISREEEIRELTDDALLRRLVDRLSRRDDQQ